MSRRRPVTGRTRLLVTTLVLTLVVSACRTDEAGTEIVTPTADPTAEAGQPVDDTPAGDDATGTVDDGPETEADGDTGADGTGADHVASTDDTAPDDDTAPTDDATASDDDTAPSDQPDQVTVVMSEAEIAELEADLDEIDQLLRDMEQAFADD